MGHALAMDANPRSAGTLGLLIFREKSAAATVLFAFISFLITGCSKPAGYGSGPPPPPATQVAITAQPANQAVPVGRTATFAVTATGTAPILYQWSKNGAPIAGATTSSYTTSTVDFADTGTTYQVAVSNAVNSITSSTVTLTAGPRAPAIGDLRYLLLEQIAAPGLTYGINKNILPGQTIHFPNEVGSPLMIGSSADCYPGVDFDCTWHYQTFTVPGGINHLTMYYKSGAFISLNSDLLAIPTPNGVIVSLDLEPDNKVYAVAWVQTDEAGGFDYRMEAVPQSQLAATVAAAGAASRVVTAVGLDSGTGMADIISYGWQGDTTTVFETTAQILSPEALASASRALANQGYIISAFGGNDTNGYALVGVRIKGDTMPRPVLCSVLGSDTWTNNPNSAYATPLIYFEDPPQVPFLIVEEQ